MRLCKFEIKNFKGLQNTSFEWDEIIILIGGNNTGKSTVLQALQWFLSGGQIKDEALFFDKLTDEEHAIELIGYFDQLTQEEKQAPAVRGRMNGEQWVIKKRFWLEMGNAEETERSWKELYYSFSSRETFVDWPDNETSWSNFSSNYQDLIDRIPNRGPRTNTQTRNELRELVRQYKPELISQTEPLWIQNPGGGGNWKSNANSIIPRFILVKAVHDATDEANSKEASSYGKIISLIVEKKMMRRPEVVELRRQIENVLKLFCPDPEHPECQAIEIRDIQDRINERLNDVIGGITSIKTSDPDIRPILLPSTTLVIKDRPDSLETPIAHQGHGLQRTLIMTLLQILVEIQSEPEPDEEGTGESSVITPKPVILAIEEPELYMHPQMERKMRDTLYRLASKPRFQVICSTHSPIFLDMAQKHKSIIRVVKNSQRRVVFFQVSEELFEGDDAESERERLRLMATFNPTVNEVFFATRAVLLEEQTAIYAFERAAELVGIFDRHPHIRRDLTLIDCCGKRSIPMFQKVLNHFKIPYTVIHDEDRGNISEEQVNSKIEQFLDIPGGQNKRYMIGPNNIEGMLGCADTGKAKPYKALKKVEELHMLGSLPSEFLKILNWVYFGQDTEPSV